MAKLDSFKDHFILLCEAGFIAVNQADEDAATKLFRASTLLNPKNNLPKIGLGYMHLMKLELPQACKIFQEVLEVEPDNEMAKTFLGLSYAFTTTSVAQGEALLEQMASEGHTSEIKNLATSALGFIEKFIKKEGNKPMTPPAKKKTPSTKKKK